MNHKTRSMGIHDDSAHHETALDQFPEERGDESLCSGGIGSVRSPSVEFARSGRLPCLAEPGRWRLLAENGPAALGRKGLESGRPVTPMSNVLVNLSWTYSGYLIVREAERCQDDVPRTTRGAFSPYLQR